MFAQALVLEWYHMGFRQIFSHKHLVEYLECIIQVGYVHVRLPMKYRLQYLLKCLFDCLPKRFNSTYENQNKPNN